MFTEITKTFEANQQLAKDITSQLTTAAATFTRTVVDVNTQLAATFKAQATEAYKNLEAFRVPGMDAFATKTGKK